MDLIVSVLWLYERQIPELTWPGMLEDIHASLRHLSRMFGVARLESFENVQDLIGQTGIVKAAIAKRHQDAEARHFGPQA